MLAEYVKVCSLYGAGFYYIPGTDICLKIGAYFRAEYAVGNQGGSLTNLDSVGLDGQRTRITGADYQQRARAFVFLDSRQQTAYGTLRAYMNIGWTDDFPTTATVSGVNSAAAVYANRAFMQLAGFTWGLATSYYDFYSSPATAFSVPWSSDTGDGGWKVAAYTAQLGNGVSASLSLEEPRRTAVVNASLTGAISGTTGAFGAFAAPGVAGTASPLWITGGNTPTDEKKIQWPDIVANLRIDQAWGSAQIMGALHDVGAGYYGNTAFGVTCGTAAASNGTTCVGHPSDKVGFAIGGGIKINFPMIGPGDYFQGQINYTEGASRYAAFTQPNAFNPGIFGNANSNQGLGAGVFSDAVYCGTGTGGATAVFGAAACPAGGSNIQLTTVWGVNASYEHFWTPSLRTSLVGAWTDISYNNAASQMLAASACGGAGTYCPTGIFAGGAAVTTSSGRYDWQFWSLSSRTQWNITKDFYVGLEGYYGHLNTAMGNEVVVYTGTTTGAQPTQLRTMADQDVFVYRMRVHRDLVP